MGLGHHTASIVVVGLSGDGIGIDLVSASRRRLARVGRRVGSSAVGHTDAINALVVHSPLVGPSTVRPLAVALSALGWSTTAPDLRGAVIGPQRFAQRAVDQCGHVEVVVGHSGAGAVLPAITESTGARAKIFIDAVLPDATVVFKPAGQFIELLDTIPTDDGLLAPWHKWWPAEVLAELIPDHQTRAAIVAEIPQVPRSFYAEAVALPPTWWTRPAAYLQLSPAYADERSRAERWGWPTSSVDGRHLDLVIQPDRVAHQVADLVEDLDLDGC